MVDIMLADMDLKELKKLRSEVEKAIDTFEQRKLDEARSFLEEEARKLGVTLEDVAGAPRTKKARKKTLSTARFRNPDDSSQTWTGKGRKPKWFTDALDNGSSVEDMEISS